jgi:RNAse (barnase) inhibitor barstar
MTKVLEPLLLKTCSAPYVAGIVQSPGQSLTRLLLKMPLGFVCRVVRGDRCKTKGGLLHEMAQELEFPGYFGNNWDALDECLGDLEWLRATGFAFIFTNAHEVLCEEEDDYRIFIEVLESAGTYWAGAQPEGIPFHALLAIPQAHLQERPNWRVPLLTLAG